MLSKSLVTKKKKIVVKERHFYMDYEGNPTCCALGNVGNISHSIFEGEPRFGLGLARDQTLFAFDELTKYIDDHMATNPDPDEYDDDPEFWDVKAVTYTTTHKNVRDGLVKAGWQDCGEIRSKMGPYPIYLLLYRCAAS